MANTHEHPEHAEHAEHNALDPFNQRVAVSMAIVAALLAEISMVGHRTHNLVLQMQGDANRLDIAHLLAEVGLVLCSIALLTKKKAYWFIGLLAAVLSLALTTSAYMIPHHPHEPATPDTKAAH